MLLVSVEDVRKHFGPEPVLDGVTFDVRPGERIGLVGPNGSGKTTLLRILAGREEADSGRCERHPAVRIGYLEQQPVFEPDRTLWDEARHALAPLVALGREAVEVAEALARQPEGPEHDRLAARYDRLQQELHRHDAYNLDHKIERVLDGLEFSRASFAQPVASLSGGEQNRLMLAKLLLAEPDLMLLDEPSNHLDIEATAWLEDYLAAGEAAVIVVSHDRYFLDKVTNRTIELFRGTVESYRGNFSAYWRQKDDRLLVQRRTYERQQEEIAKTEDFIRRNAYGQKHAQAEDRRKKLSRIERVPPPREIVGPPMAFPAAQRSGDIVLRAVGLAKAFDRPLFAGLDFELIRGDRWGILGPNGSGKTTLLRCLLGRTPPDAGRVTLGQGVDIAYFDQQLAALDDAQPVVEAIRPEGRLVEEQKRRDLLARFGLTGDVASQPVGRLSGGERCRAALARLAALEANVLVLDEPTNHLDLWARDALERALARFDGTVVFVSHDRYFVNRLANHLLVVEPGRFRAIEGNYDTYAHLVREGLGGPVEPAPSREMPPSEARVPPGADAPASERPKRRFPYRKVDEIEADIFRHEGDLAELHAALALPDTHRDGDRVRQINARIEATQAELAALYAHWEEATELNW
ncbi:MAG: ABC-F family ATP-binding cassette domain-containing protein [Pirellulales bacterium]|nr:ABC-F family ATP-binding cassette domain-containing protein [Pirellulales bacterium]